MRRGDHRTMDNLPAWALWIIMAGIGLSPILTFWIAGVLGRHVRRRMWARIGSDRGGLRHLRSTRQDHRRRDDERG